MTRRTKKLPTPGEAIALWAVVLVANTGLAWLLMRSSQVDLLLLVTPSFVLISTAVAAVVFRLDLRPTFLLRWPSGFDLLMAIPLAISFVVLSDQLNNLTSSVMPIGEIRDALTRTMTAETPSQWVARILGGCALAAVSEELLFRGFLLAAFERSSSRRHAIVWSAFLFMLMHAIFLPSLLFAGVVLGVVALASRSIAIPIVVHFTNNLTVLALINLAKLDTLGDPTWIPLAILLPALAIFLLTMGYFLRKLALAALEPQDRGNVDAKGDTTGAPTRSHLSLPRQESRTGLFDELAEVEPRRRRAGWLLAATAVLGGSIVLLGLFGFSAYMSFPQQHHRAFIEHMRSSSVQRLSPEALERSDELTSAFDALDAVNEASALKWRHVAAVATVVARSTSDGSVSTEDVDDLISAIRDVVASTAAPRRL
jgi:membrane protease YdiL (CAAX protease family)